MLVAVLLTTPDTASVIVRPPDTVIHHTALLHQLMMAESVAPDPPFAHLVERIPYEQELHEFYHRFHADRRWRNGIGITFALGYQKHRWTIGLGPVQFGFGGHPPPGR